MILFYEYNNFLFYNFYEILITVSVKIETKKTFFIILIWGLSLCLNLKNLGFFVYLNPCYNWNWAKRYFSRNYTFWNFPRYPYFSYTVRSNDVVQRIKDGEDKLIGFLVGQIIKSSGGNINPSIAKDLLLKEL